MSRKSKEQSEKPAKARAARSKKGSGLPDSLPLPTVTFTFDLGGGEIVGKLDDFAAHADKSLADVYRMMLAGVLTAMATGEGVRHEAQRDILIGNELGYARVDRFSPDWNSATGFSKAAGSNRERFETATQIRDFIISRTQESGGRIVRDENDWAEPDFDAGEEEEDADFTAVFVSAIYPSEEIAEQVMDELRERWGVHCPQISDPDADEAARVRFDIPTKLSLAEFEATRAGIDEVCRRRDGKLLNAYPARSGWENPDTTIHEYQFADPLATKDAARDIQDFYGSRGVTTTWEHGGCSYSSYPHDDVDESEKS